ncbi:UNVERIFIED_ORG: hypothetical protein QOE_2638 [Clostridioides difficile F501]
MLSADVASPPRARFVSPNPLANDGSPSRRAGGLFVSRHPYLKTGFDALSATFSTSWQTCSRSLFPHQVFLRQQGSAQVEGGSEARRNPWWRFVLLATKSKKLQKRVRFLFRDRLRVTKLGK